MTKLDFNPILGADGYKLGHQFLYPRDTTGMFAYIEARTGGKDIFPLFGLQYYLKKYLTVQLTKGHIDEAEVFCKSYGVPFFRNKWEYLIEKHNGYFPLKIRSVDEGALIPSGNAIVTIECDDPEVFWLVSFVETMLQSSVWYMSTVVANGYKTKMMMRRHYVNTGSNLGFLAYALHDFAARSVGAYEQAECGGAAHLVNFTGSDTMAGARCVNLFYGCDQAAATVLASEHSIECSFGPEVENEVEYIKNCIETAKSLGLGIVSIVADGYDIYRASDAICSLKNFIIDSGVWVVTRPDSGEFLSIVPMLLQKFSDTFGYDENEKGYRKVRYISVIQGDGMDHNSIDNLLGKLEVHRWSADNIVTGMGSRLLHFGVHRDQYKVAMKTSSVRRNDVWIETVKNPITDPGKKSKGGRLSVARHKVTGEYHTYRLEDGLVTDVYEDVMKVRYDCGTLYNETVLSEVRERIGTWN